MTTEKELASVSCFVFSTPELCGRTMLLGFVGLILSLSCCKVRMVVFHDLCSLFLHVALFTYAHDEFLQWSLLHWVLRCHIGSQPGSRLYRLRFLFRPRPR